MRAVAAIGLPVCLGLILLAGSARAAGDPTVAALQVALRDRGLYDGSVDGVAGPGTAGGVRTLQQRAGLEVDGVPGPRTRAALGQFGRHRLGTRVLLDGTRGWDVAALQFLLAAHGFPSGPLDGLFGVRTEAALRRFQRFAGLGVDGTAGPATLAALRTASPRSPLPLRWPLAAGLSDPFGPRGSYFHAGIDLRADSGTSVAAAGDGEVVFAGFHAGGLGLLVTVRHPDGVRTRYAHLSRIDVTLGRPIAAGAQIGLVGSTGHSTGPHLHFEVLVRGAAVDPLTALP